MITAAWLFALFVAIVIVHGVDVLRSIRGELRAKAKRDERLLEALGELHFEVDAVSTSLASISQSTRETRDQLEAHRIRFANWAKERDGKRVR